MLPIIVDNHTQVEYANEINAEADDIFKAPFPEIVNTIIACYMVSVASLSVIGNSAVWLTFLPKRDGLLPVDYLTLNLALSDFLVALICWPLAITSAFKQRWSWGLRGCVFYGFTSFFLLLCSEITIVAIAVLRYFIICRNESNDKLYKMVFRLIIFVWIFSFVTTILPILGWNRYYMEPYRISCAPDWTARGFSNISYCFTLIVTCLIVPLAICVFCYTEIFRKIYRGEDANRSRTRMQMQHKLIRSAFAVTVCYMIAWTPYSIVSIWHAIVGVDSVPLWIAAIPVVIAKSTSLFNPVIYLIYNATFRQDTKSIVQCCGCRCCCLSVNEDHEVWLRVMKIQKSEMPSRLPRTGLKVLLNPEGSNVCNDRLSSVGPLTVSPSFYNEEPGPSGVQQLPNCVSTGSRSTDKRAPLAEIQELIELGEL